MDEAVFIVSAAIILVGSCGVVLSRNPVHSALFLVQTLFGVAVLFVLQEAHFLAAVQVIVYAGAIVILFLFVIMLLGVDRAESLEIEPIAGQRPLAVIIGAAVTGIVLTVVLVATDAITGVNPTDAERLLTNNRTDVERLGRVIFTDYAFVFEATAALLTIAVVGAVVLTRRVRGELADAGEPESFDLPPVAPESGSEDH